MPIWLDRLDIVAAAIVSGLDIFLVVVGHHPKNETHLKNEEQKTRF